MSASDFRQLTLGGNAPKGERLFRAAVSAFCSLTRPSRRDISQLEDLTLPLFDSVSPESRRYVAAALAECPHPPPALVRRLADEPLEIAAPLLIRSDALTDVDLIALIGRHGPGHARAIRRRRRLNPVIADLIALIDRKSREEATRGVLDNPPRATQQPEPGQGSSDVRRRLRAMMLPSGRDGGRFVPWETAYARLRDAALSGHPSLFHTAVAEVLAIDHATVRRLAEGPSRGWLLAALRAFELSEERAFLIAAAVQPGQFPDATSMRLFLDRYRTLGRQQALARLAAWTDDGPAGSAETRLHRPETGKPGADFTAGAPG